MARKSGLLLEGLDENYNPIPQEPEKKEMPLNQSDVMAHRKTLNNGLNRIHSYLVQTVNSPKNTKVFDSLNTLEKESY